MRTHLKGQRFTTMASTLALAVASPVALAQTQQAQQGSEASVPLLEEIVVTAQKREQTLQEVPVSLEVLSGDMLQVERIFSLQELARFNPALNFRNDANGTNTAFALRGIGGFAAQAGIEPAIGIVVDGVPYARAAEFFAADLEDIQRVEILKGPQGTLFGASNAGGVVNITTRKPSEQFEASAEFSGTSDEEFATRASISGALSDRIRGRASGYFKTREGHLVNVFTDEGDLSRLGEQEEIGFRGVLDIDLLEDVTVLLTGSYNELDRSQSRQPTVVEPEALFGDVGPARLAAQGLGDPILGQQVVDDPFLVSQDGLSEEDIDRWRVSATVSWDISSSISLTSITSYTDFDDIADIDVDSSAAGPLNDFGLQSLVGIPRTNTNIKRPISARTFTSSADYVTQELRLEGVGDTFDWTFGGYYQNLQDNFDISTPFFSKGAGGRPPNVFLSGPRDANIDRQLYSTFADATWHGPYNLDFFGGLRVIQERGKVRFQRTVTIIPDDSDLLTLLPDDGGTVLVDPSALNNIADISFRTGTSPTGWAGRTGVSWRYTPDHSFYFQASRGFTGFGVNTGNATTAETAIVNPSTSRSLEVGTKSILFDSLRVNLALFATEVKDLQASILPGAGQIDVFNAGRLRSKGVEGDLQWVVPWLPDLQLSAAFTLMDTDLKDLVQPCFPGQTAEQGCLDLDGDGSREQDLQNRPTLDAPNQAFNIRARYDLDSSVTGLPFNVYIAPSYSWKSRVATNIAFNPDASFIDSFGVLDLSVGFVSRDERFELTVFGTNITDKQFVGNIQQQPTVTGLAAVNVPRDARDIWGGSFKINF